MVPRNSARSRHDLTMIPAGTGTRRMPATVAMTTAHRSTMSRVVRDSWLPCPALVAGGSAGGGLSGEAGEGGAGVTVIGANMLRSAVSGYDSGARRPTRVGDAQRQTQMTQGGLGWARPLPADLAPTQ